ncbi:uncharacterized protein [Arachis hypogaea]|uniref:uncharacterized protein n=1 Tax=Arachis hypogaea TaxID=3818 RepID=UPI003B218502
MNWLLWTREIEQENEICGSNAGSNASAPSTLSKHKDNKVEWEISSDPQDKYPISNKVQAVYKATRVAEATKQAIKQKIAPAATIDVQSRSIPAKLRIEVDDLEDEISYSIRLSFPNISPLSTKFISL